MSITSPSPEIAGVRGERVQSQNEFWHRLKLSLHGHVVFIVIATAFFLSAKIMTSFLVLEPSAKSGSILWMFLTATLPVIVLSVFINRFIFMVIFVKPKHPIRALMIELKTFFLSTDRMANGIPMVAAIVPFISAYVEVKAAIPHLNPFSWDIYFSELDRWLHMGFHPWQWLQPVLGWPIVTFIFNISYNIWFIVMWMIWSWLAFSRHHSHTRFQFFLSFMLCWIIGGSIFAVTFSSAGPAYYSNLGLSPDPYSPLISYLREANQIFPIWALDTQQLLWDGYMGKQSIVVGISAMPSMHNASAILFALAGWSTNRKLGWILTGYAAVILVGSVHLGWHYAVDGYFSIVLALTMWWISGKISSAVNRVNSVRQYQQAFQT